MKTVGDKLRPFKMTGVKPGALTPDNAFEEINDLSFEGKWKVIVYYPKDFTFVCPTEIVAYDKLNKDFADRDAVLLRATFIVDPQNVIQHVTVNNLNVGRNADETLRILDALQTGELCQCNRQVGEATLNAA